jgi:hypothetical protein
MESNRQEIKMTEQQIDAAMDLAQDLLVKRVPRQEVVARVASEFGQSNAEKIVADTESHPITKIIIARQ